jgi:RNA polymerase sigma-70 factor, ECF subfamily
MEGNPMTNDDDRLIERIRDRDEDAFALLVNRHQDALRRHLMRTVRDEEAAGDLLQEVFLRTWTRAEQWDGRGGVKQWLFRIATNLALNHLRTVRRRRETPLELPPSLEDDQVQIPAWMVDTESESPYQTVERAERVQKMYGMVDELSDEKREVWALIHNSGMGVIQTAEMLGIPEGTVKSRLYHARQQLAREWNKTMDEWENN